MSQLLGAALLACSLAAHALGEPKYVSLQPVAGGFTLAASGKAAPIFVDQDDWPGVVRAASDLAEDLHRVTGMQPQQLHKAEQLHGIDAVVIGTIGHSPVIDKLIAEHRIGVDDVRGKWESVVTAIVEHPMPGVERALVIAGSDKRGTIFGIYDLSEQIGVSPWYWWADVRIPHRDTLVVEPGRHLQPEPAVRYRGIFLNDEAPALSGWTHEKFGGFNSKFYMHVFELLLRLRANYLWPAMWGNAFNEDDPENPRLADEYGIVMGTSHHEPMLRAQQEWKKHGKGPWDYNTNAAVLDDFWTKGIERNRNFESTVTLGMRGDGDEPMTEGANIALLEKIVANQRAILARYPTHHIQTEPKVWALYKEVQDYYERGMRVPDDVTLLWCDDNWGNIRRLPTPEERKRSGGAGIYYHFDYVGDPRSYKWLNTYSITKVWEQMNLALHYGADRIWIVNVGDLKPMEFPIEFFLTMARTPNRWDQNHLDAYTQAWATREFGPEHASEIAKSVTDYTRFNARRKPEQLTPTTFSLTHFDEAERVDRAWRELAQRVDALAPLLPEDQRASYFELVQYPVDASAAVNEMYIAAGKNKLYADQGRASANALAAETRSLFARDAALSDHYNHGLLDGRWNHMMDQTRIGYTTWSDPPKNVMPAVTEISLPEMGTLQIAVNELVAEHPKLDSFDSITQPTRSFTLFNKGRTPVSYRASASASWIRLSRNEGTVEQQERIDVAIDWSKAPTGSTNGSITITPQAGAPLQIALTAVTRKQSRSASQGFIESDGYVAIEAANADARTADGAMRWTELPGFGETQSAMTLFPVDAASDPNSKAGLTYSIYLNEAGAFTLQTILAPTLNFVPGRGLRFAVSLDEGPRKIVDTLAHNTRDDWARSVSDGVRKVSIPLAVAHPGAHHLHIWAVDPGVVLERLVLSHGAVPPSYLGAPESLHLPANIAR